MSIMYEYSYYLILKLKDKMKTTSFVKSTFTKEFYLYFYHFTVYYTMKGWPIQTKYSLRFHLLRVPNVTPNLFLLLIFIPCGFISKKIEDLHRVSVLKCKYK